MTKILVLTSVIFLVFISDFPWLFLSLCFIAFVTGTLYFLENLQSVQGRGLAVPVSPPRQGS